MNTHKDGNYSYLLEFINQCPYAILSADQSGKINLLNAAGSMLLVPIASILKKSSENILDLLEEIDSELKSKIDSFKEDHGRICDKYRVQFRFSENRIQYLSFTIIKINKDLFQYAFQDISKVVEAQESLNKLTEESALQEGRLEMSSGVLHDIGNATTAFGTEVSKLKNKISWREQEDLEKLVKLFQSKKEGIDQALGTGKAAALEKFLKAMQTSLSEKQKFINHSTDKLYQSTSHIQQILNIQRHYATGQKSSKREKIKISSVIDDAISMQEKNLQKRNIILKKHLNLDLPLIDGDKTKLIQVVINIIKNAAEAFENVDEEKNKHLIISTEFIASENRIFIEVEDNASGFEAEKGKLFFKKGVTTKSRGSGFGLMNCRQIIKSHNGEIKLTSEGPGKGAKATISLPTN